MLNIGFHNYIPIEKVSFITDHKSEPIRRMIQEKRQYNKLFDVTNGRATKSVIISSNQYYILSSLKPETIRKRCEDGGHHFISVSREAYLPSSKIDLVMSGESKPTRRTIEEHESLGKLINAKRGKKTKTTILDEDGNIILGSYSPHQVLKSIDAKKKDLREGV